MGAWWRLEQDDKRGPGWAGVPAWAWVPEPVRVAAPEVAYIAGVVPAWESTVGSRAE